MRWGLIAVFALTLVACTPPKPGPDAVVQTIYAATATRLAAGGATTEADLPMTDDLRTSLAHASQIAQQRDEPFIDGDLAANCQDCQHLTDMRTVITTPPANGRAVVEAHFKLDGADSV